MKFGVSLGITGNIWVGNLNKKGNMFLNKEDKTLEVLQAVLSLIEENDKNNKTTELTSKDMRYIFEIKKIPKEEK